MTLCSDVLKNTDNFPYLTSKHFDFDVSEFVNS